MNYGTSIGGRNLGAFIPIVTGKLLDNAKVGTFCACVGRVFTLANTDTVLAHTLGRVPNGYIVFRSSSGGVIYDASTGVAAWTISSITLRATVAGTFSFLLL